jgi:hypothetical protein
MGASSLAAQSLGLLRGLEGLVSKRRDRPYQGAAVEALGEDQEQETCRRGSRVLTRETPASKRPRIQVPVACVLHDTTPVFGDRARDTVREEHGQFCVRSFFVPRA